MSKITHCIYGTAEEGLTFQEADGRLVEAVVMLEGTYGPIPAEYTETITVIRGVLMINDTKLVAATGAAVSSMEVKAGDRVTFKALTNCCFLSVRNAT